MLASFLCGESLLHIPCWLHFYVGKTLTHPVLASFLSREFLLHIPLWLHFYVGSFSYTSRAGFLYIKIIIIFFLLFKKIFFIWGISRTHPMLICVLSFIWGVSLTHPVLASFLSGEFVLHIPCWLHFYVGSFSCTSHADFVFMWGMSLTHPVLPSFLYREFLLHIACWHNRGQ